MNKILFLLTLTLIPSAYSQIFSVGVKGSIPGLRLLPEPAVGKPNTISGTVGAGIALKLLVLRISPEIRYTYWASPASIGNFLPLQMSVNQVDFLLGFTF